MQKNLQMGTIEWVLLISLSLLWGGSYLFGSFTIADAMYAPIVNRFDVYDVAVGNSSQAYRNTIILLPDWMDWARDGAAEPWICDIVEK